MKKATSAAGFWKMNQPHGAAPCCRMIYCGERVPAMTAMTMSDRPAGSS